MGSVNKVILVGNLGKDAELKYLPNGSALSSFSMAMTERYKDRNNELKEKTEWVNITYWGKGAEAVNEYLTKGKQVYVEGSFETRKYEKNGVTHYASGVKARQVTLLGGGSGGGSRGESRDRQVNEDLNDGPEQINDDDIPF